MTDSVKYLQEHFYTAHRKGWILVRTADSPLLVTKPLTGQYRFNWHTEHINAVESNGDVTITYPIGSDDKTLQLVSMPRGLTTLLDFVVNKTKANGEVVPDYVTLWSRKGIADVHTLKLISKIDEHEYYTNLEFVPVGKYAENIPKLNVNIVQPVTNLKAFWEYESDYVDRVVSDKIYIDLPHNEDTKLELKVSPKNFIGSDTIVVEKYYFNENVPVETVYLVVDISNGIGLVAESIKALSHTPNGVPADRLVFKSQLLPIKQEVIVDLIPPPAEHVPIFELTSSMHTVRWYSEHQMNIMFVKPGDTFDIILRNTNGLYTGELDVLIPSGEGTNRTVQVSPLFNGYGLVRELDESVKAYHLENNLGMLYSSEVGHFKPLLVLYEGMPIPDSKPIVPIEAKLKFTLLPVDNPYSIELDKVTTTYNRNSEIRIRVETESTFTGTVNVYRDDYTFPVDIFNGVGHIDPVHHANITKDIVTYYVADNLTLPLEITLVDSPVNPVINKDREYPSYLTFVDKPLPSYLVMLE